MSKRFFIIDGLSQIFRCYYAPFQSLSAPGGEPTRATYVFTNMLIQMAREQKPDYLAMAMDSKEEAVFRRELAPDYKAHRQAPPEDLPPQIDRILEIVRSQGIPILAVEGFEADDLLATLCRRLGGHDDIEIFLVSKDKDLDQLLTDSVKLFDPGKSEVIGPADLREKKGFGPEHAIEVQILSGDTVDNIPGVKGIGPKKAAALIAKYGTAAAVVAHADELTPAMRANVKEFADKLELTRKLVTLRQDVPFEFDLEACRWQGINNQALLPIATHLGFTRIVQQINERLKEKNVVGQASSLSTDRQDAGPTMKTAGASPDVHWDSRTDLPRESLPAKQSTRFSENLFDLGPPPRTPESDESIETPLPQPKLGRPPSNYSCVDDQIKFAAFLAELKKQPIFAFDTETDNINPAWAKLAGLSFSWEAGKGYYLPICGVGDCLPLEPTLAALRPIFADPNVKKVGQNLKYDLVVLATHGVPLAGIAFDTMIASFVLDSSRRSHGMDALARELLGRDTIPITDLIGSGKNEITFDGVETAKAAEYAGEDADVTWQLYQVFREQLDGSDLGPLFHETEMPLVEVLAAMESEGVRLDTDVLAKMSNELAARLHELTRQIHKEVGHAFNIDSTKQLAAVLFDELKLPVVKSTQKKARSTDAETLASLAASTQHPVPTLVKEYRELVKLKGTYIDTLPEMICERTHRIHCSFHQTGAVTGRLSSSDPNLQNIPIRTEIGRQIRRAFVPRDAGHVLLTADYSQIELRVLAHFCGDATLRQAFLDDRDIHQFVAAQVFGVSLKEVTKEQRSRSKAVNFGIIYGQSAYGLSRTTGMSSTEAQTFIDMYFQRYPGIRAFIDATLETARRVAEPFSRDPEGSAVQVPYVRTILGRRRSVPDLNSRNRNLRTAAERFAVNTVIQGSAADLIKRAMIAIHRRIVSESRPARMIIQVHDELVFDIPRTAVTAESEMIRQEMSQALPLSVPIKVDIAYGDNWLEGK